ncbi:hypothetical protein B0T18DRAFT_464697 [Schizothecium vesticola]|uniref:Uncharacterized protein n=1 Tax=Schizothecium vesticola TaxID=314040 RepID=A0AA40K4X7_9PEZI|nr:hypothetical protein B0T18DRAFT_464697 [Schizothecium vesticola]
MEVTMWRGMRQQSDRLLPFVKPGSRPIDYQEVIDLALRDAKHLEGMFQNPAGITLPKSGIIATVCRALAQALRSGCPTVGTIKPHMRSGVFVLFHEYIERFTADMRFASDADEAGGLLVDACLSLVGTVFQQRADTLNDCAAQGAREQEDDPSLDSGWFVGVGVMVCRHCGNGDPIGQVSKDVYAGRDKCEVFEEKEAEPREETDGWEETVDDEEQESGWTTICREN